MKDNNVKQLLKELIKDGHRSIPNLMSVFRVILIPAILIVYMKGYSIGGVVLVIVSALTDMFDGIIARKYNMVTDLGKALDPIADKLTLGAIMICLAVEEPGFISVVVFMAAKETIGLIMRWKIFKNGWGMYGANWYGKVSTWVMYITAGCVMVFKKMPGWVLVILICLCVISIAYAAYRYTVQCRQIIREREKEK